MRRTTAARGSLGLLLAAGTAALLVACTASGGPAPSPTPSEPTPDPSVSEPEPNPWVSVIVTAEGGSVEVFDTPEALVPALTVTAADAVSYPDATPLTFLVLDEAEDRTADPDDAGAGDADRRLHVLLPGAVDGEAPVATSTPLELPTGWVRESDVTVATTDLRIEVRLGDGRLLLHRADEVMLDVPIDLGPAAPRPGRTFLTELVTPPSADGPYGAYAYGLAGYPTALAGFGSADGLVGLHGGADDPGSPPDPGSSDPGDVDPGDPSTGTDDPGSVRLSDADVTRLVTELGLPLGTPVDVVA